MPRLLIRADGRERREVNFKRVRKVHRVRFHFKFIEHLHKIRSCLNCR